MRILIVADVYPPEVSSAANLMVELAQGLRHRGHDVAVITAYPKHYLTEASKGKTFEECSEENGIRVIRVKILPHHKVNFVLRGISQLTMPFLFFLKARKYVRGKADAAIVYSPPLPLGLIGKMLKYRYGAKIVLSLQDIFPQNAIDLGVIKNKIVIKFFELIEQIVYRTVDKITFHSEGGRNFLITKKHVPPEKIAMVPNWIDFAPFEKIANPISFRERYGLKDKFIILFAGILGPAQGVEFIVETAKKVADLKDMVFLLVGDGMEKSKVEHLVKEHHLSNVILKPFVSKEEYPSLVEDVDVGLVCLSNKNKTPFVPGKFLGYMAAGKPVLAFLNKESDGFHLMKEAHCGEAVESEMLEDAVRAVRKLYGEKTKLPELGENGFIYAKNHFALEVCIKKIEHLIS